MTGQCRKYVPSDTRPRYVIGRVERNRFAAPALVFSSATINTDAKTATKRPLVVGLIENVDVANTTSASREGSASARIARRAT